MAREKILFAGAEMTPPQSKNWGNRFPLCTICNIEFKNFKELRIHKYAVHAIE